MLRAYTSASTYAAERPALAAGEPLMARAARALADTIERYVPREEPIVVFAGRGNNGADALYAAGHLARAEYAVTTVIAFEERDAPDANISALRSAREAGVQALPASGDCAPYTEALSAPVWVDGLAGIGMRPPARGAIRDLLTSMERAHRTWFPTVFAVDLPSGLGADTGRVHRPVIPADHTVTFGGYKPVHLLPPAADLCGRVHVIDIGIHDALLGQPVAVGRMEPRDVAAQLSAPGPADHKYTRGVVGLVTGSNDYPGAAVLSTGGAIAAGPGMVRYLGEVPGHVVRAYPEVVTQSGRVQAWAVGSGISGRGSSAARAVDRALDHGLSAGVPIVVDAGALEWVEPGGIAGHVATARVVLTPHAGELAGLLRRCGVDVDRAEVEADPVVWARKANEVTGASVVLKGSTTLIVVEGEVCSQADGTPWMATAGTGDVLAGILGAALATWGAGEDGSPLTTRASFACALAAGVALHGMAGTRASGGGPIRATEIATYLPTVVRELLAD